MVLLDQMLLLVNVSRHADPLTLTPFSSMGPVGVSYLLLWLLFGSGILKPAHNLIFLVVMGAHLVGQTLFFLLC